jgi:hypothetical protein
MRERERRIERSKGQKKRKVEGEKKRRKEKEVRYGPKSLRFAGAFPFEHAGGVIGHAVFLYIIYYSILFNLFSYSLYIIL